MIKLKSLLKENNQEKASLRLILHLDKKFPTKQKGHFPLSMRNKIAKYIYQMTKDTIADRGHSLGGGLQYSEKGKKQIAKNLAMGYETFIKKGYQSPIKKNDIKGSDIRLMAKETMRYVKIPSIKNILKENKRKDLLKVATTLGKSPSDIMKFLKKYKLDADDLLDVIETGGRRYSLAIIAAMRGNRRALRQLDNLLGFL